MLRQAVGQDLERRNLGQDARSALEALESPQGRARRIVACELLRRCLWLHWHTLNNPHILEHMTFQGIADKWALMITNTEVDDDILERFGITRAEFDAMDAAPPFAPGRPRLAGRAAGDERSQSKRGAARACGARES